ncbi:tRNA-binding protein [Candidatus Peribacteria bacterium]|nr:tRNA-binding protein [Candidatus Peribacteria bacterium]
MHHCTYDDFLRVEICLGTVVSAQPYPEARRSAYILHIDCGPVLGVKQSSAQITAHYTPEQLLGRRVMVVSNVPPKQVGRVMSEVLVLGFHDAEGGVVLAQPDVPSPPVSLPNGTRLL